MGEDPDKWAKQCEDGYTRFGKKYNEGVKSCCCGDQNGPDVKICGRKASKHKDDCPLACMKKYGTCGYMIGKGPACEGRRGECENPHHALKIKSRSLGLAGAMGAYGYAIDPDDG